MTKPSLSASSPSSPLDFLSYLKRSQPVPTNQLVECIRNRDWQGARQRAITHPWDAQFLGQASLSTALHLACVYRAPLPVVEAVLDAFPKNIAATDGEGWTPLHVAILYGVDEQTILTLIKRGGAHVASIQSRLVGSPLHVACRHNASPTILRELLKVHPKMALAKNQSGIQPATLLYYEFARNPSNAVIVTGLLLDKPIDVENDTISKLMERILLLINAIAGRDLEDRQVLFLHEAVRYQTTLGLENIIPLAIQLYPEQLSIRDANGNLPLHVAARLAEQQSPQQQQRYGRFQAADSLLKVLQAFPEAACCCNANGRLPLHLALEFGGRSWNSGIRQLVEAAPKALTTRDTTSRFYPVLTAAAAATSQRQENLDSLNTVFQLLLAWPPVLQHSMRE